MSLSKSQILFSAFILLAIVMTGCSKYMDTEYVEGLVTLDGEPVAEAHVVFRPVTEGEGDSASGYTDENGVYRLSIAKAPEGMTIKQDSGTTPGEYMISVTKQRTAGEPVEAPSAEDYVPPESSGEDVPDIRFLVPEKYKNPRSSGLTATVTAGEENNIPLELTSDKT